MYGRIEPTKVVEKRVSKNMIYLRKLKNRKMGMNIFEVLFNFRSSNLYVVIKCLILSGRTFCRQTIGICRIEFQSG
jgi:hypothetical protein